MLVGHRSIIEKNLNLTLLSVVLAGGQIMPPPLSQEEQEQAKEQEQPSPKSYRKNGRMAAEVRALPKLTEYRQKNNINFFLRSSSFFKLSSFLILSSFLWSTLFYWVSSFFSLSSFLMFFLRSSLFLRSSSFLRTFDGERPLMEDNLWWKTILMEDNLCQPLIREDLCL